MAFVICTEPTMTKQYKELIHKFTDTENPVWKCPACGMPTLTIVRPSFFEMDNAESRKWIAQDGSFHPYDLSGGSFSTLLQCRAPHCKEVVACSGKIDRDIDYRAGENDEDLYITRFTPTHFTPPLRPIHIPEECEGVILEPLLDSFTVVPGCASAAANLLRIAVEKMLDVLNVKAMRNLHDRIICLKKTEPEKAELLMSIKHLGNTGSHEYGKVDPCDVLDGYHIFEKILKQMHPEQEVDLSMQKSQNLTAKYGPKP